MFEDLNQQVMHSIISISHETAFQAHNAQHVDAHSVFRPSPTGEIENGRGKKRVERQPDKPQDVCKTKLIVDPKETRTFLHRALKMVMEPSSISMHSITPHVVGSGAFHGDAQSPSFLVMQSITDHWIHQSYDATHNCEILRGTTKARTAGKGKERLWFKGQFGCRTHTDSLRFSRPFQLWSALSICLSVLFRRATDLPT